MLPNVQALNLVGTLHNHADIPIPPERSPGNARTSGPNAMQRSLGPVYLCTSPWPNRKPSRLRSLFMHANLSGKDVA